MAILQYQIIQRPVADVTTLKALDVTTYSDGAIITVKAKGMYRYDPLSSATPDDDKVVEPSAGPGRWLRMTDAEIDSHTENFPDLGDVTGFYAKADAIVTNNDVPDGLVEGGGTLSSTGALKVVSAQLSLGSVVNEISNDTTLEDKATAVVTEHVLKNVKDNRQPLDSDLTALAALNTDGLVTRTGTSTYATRAIVGAINQINVADGDGIAGNPTLTTPQDIATTSSPTFASLSTTGNINGATPTEIGYLSGVSSAIQTQLNTKSPDFDGDQIFWVSGNGSDTLNNGKDDNKPFATLNKGLTEARLLSPVAGNEFAIVCLEGGDFTEDLAIDSYIHVYAPNATINGQITVEANASVLTKNQVYSGTGVALTRSGGGTDQGHASVDFISCTSTGDAIENSGGNFEINIDRVETNNGNGVQITGTNTTHTSGYINSIICVNGGNCVDVSGLNVLSFGMSFGKLNSDNATAISLTSNAKVNINAIEVSGTNAYVVNSATAELNLSVTKLEGNETVTLGTANVINPSGNSVLNGTLKATSLEGATGNAVTGFSDDITMAADSTSLGVTQHAVKTYADNIAAGIHWQTAVIDEVDFTTAEPGSPSVGDRYINTVTGTSSGTAQSVTEDYIYEWNGTDWTETVVLEGYACYVNDEDTYKVYNGTSWINLNSTQTFIGLQDTYSSYTKANAFVQNNSTTDGLIESTITANGGAISEITSLTLTTGGTITTTTGSITISTGSGSNDDIDLIPDGTGVVKLGKELDVNSKALSSVASINTVTWPVGGGSIGDIPTLTGPTTAAWQAPAAGGIDAVVDDTTPQLGGNLDVNGKSIVSMSNGDVKISPDGTGDIVLDGTIDTLGNSVTTTTGNTGIYGSSAGGDVTIASTNGGNVSINAQFGGGAGILNVGGAIDDTTYINTFTWPVADGTNGQVLTTNGSKVLSFTTAAGGGVSAIPKNLLVSGDFSKIPLWIQSVGLTGYADATLVTPSFLILHNTTAQAERDNSFTDQNELVLQLTGSGYLGGYEPLYAAEFYSAFTELKAASETLSVGFFGRATGITQIKMDIIQWIPGTSASCIKDPIAAWGATPTLDSDATGAWSYVASSSALTISGSNSIIKWEDISTASFNTSATRLGLVIRTAGTETSGDNIVIKKLAMHRGASFAGFEDRDEVTKTETRIACTYNFRVPKGTTSQMASAIHSCFAYEVEPDMMHAAHFNYNTTLVEVPAIADVTVYNPVSGVAGQVEELDGSNITIETIDALSQHSISVLAEPDDGWSNNFKMHAIVWIKAYQ